MHSTEGGVSDEEADAKLGTAMKTAALLKNMKSILTHAQRKTYIANSTHDEDLSRFFGFDLMFELLCANLDDPGDFERSLREQLFEMALASNPDPNHKKSDAEVMSLLRNVKVCLRLVDGAHVEAEVRGPPRAMEHINTGPWEMLEVMGLRPLKMEMAGTSGGESSDDEDTDSRDVIEDPGTSGEADPAPGPVDKWPTTIRVEPRMSFKRAHPKSDDAKGLQDLSIERPRLAGGLHERVSPHKSRERLLARADAHAASAASFLSRADTTLLTSSVAVSGVASSIVQRLFAMTASTQDNDDKDAGGVLSDTPSSEPREPHVVYDATVRELFKPSRATDPVPDPVAPHLSRSSSGNVRDVQPTAMTGSEKDIPVHDGLVRDLPLPISAMLYMHRSTSETSPGDMMKSPRTLRPGESLAHVPQFRLESSVTKQLEVRGYADGALEASQKSGRSEVRYHPDDVPAFLNKRTLSSTHRTGAPGGKPGADAPSSPPRTLVERPCSQRMPIVGEIVFRKKGYGSIIVKTTNGKRTWKVAEGEPAVVETVDKEYGEFQLRNAIGLTSSWLDRETWAYKVVEDKAETVAGSADVKKRLEGEMRDSAQRTGAVGGEDPRGIADSKSMPSAAVTTGDTNTQAGETKPPDTERSRRYGGAVDRRAGPRGARRRFFEVKPRQKTVQRRPSLDKGQEEKEDD